MAFTEKLKLEIKQRAHFSCCLCKSLGVEIHHIVPQEENGPDTVSNAAPLCPSCHETYGANRTKRKFIREARDFWYEICDKRYASDSHELNELKGMLKNVPSLNDLSNLKNEILSALNGGKPSNLENIVHSKGDGSITADPNLIELSLNDLLSHYLQKPYASLKDHYHILYNDLLWDEEDRIELRDPFIVLFGETFAKILCLEAQSSCSVNLSEGFTEDDLAAVWKGVLVNSALWMFLSEGTIKASVNASGEIFYTKLPEDVV